MSVLQQLLMETSLTCCKNIHDGVGLNVKMKFRLPSHKNVLCVQMAYCRCRSGLPSCSCLEQRWVRWALESGFFGDLLWGRNEMAKTSTAKACVVPLPTHPEPFTSSPSNQQIHSCLGISWKAEREMYLMINSWINYKCQSASEWLVYHWALSCANTVNTDPVHSSMGGS